MRQYYLLQYFSIEKETYLLFYVCWNVSLYHCRICFWNLLLLIVHWEKNRINVCKEAAKTCKKDNYLVFSVSSVQFRKRLGPWPDYVVFDWIFSCFEQLSAEIFFSTQVRRFWQTADLDAKVVNIDTHWVTGTSVGWFSSVQGFWEASNQKPKDMPRKTAESIAEGCMGCSIASPYNAYSCLPFIES